MSTEATKTPLPPRDSPSGLVTLGRVAGALGLVLALSAPLTWFLTGESGVLLWGKLVLAAILVGIYVLTNPQFWRRLVGSRSSGLAALSGASIVVAVGVVGVVNYLAFAHPKQFDLTKEGLYTLSEQTQGVLARLGDDVKVYAFFASSDPAYPSVQETLARYKAVSPRLAFEMVDPMARPDLVKQFHLTRNGPPIVITARGQEARAKDASEEELTNGIIKVAEQTSKTVWFLTGHGEADIDGDGDDDFKRYAQALRDEGYSVEKLSLLHGREAKKGEKLNVDLGNKPARRKPAAPAGKAATALASTTPGAPGSAGDEVAIPSGVSTLVIAGPRTPLLAPEVAALEGYLAKGGRLLLMLDADSDGGLTGLCAQWKVDVHKDVVVDTNPINRLLGFGAAAPMVQPAESAADHPVVKDLVAPAVFMTTRSLAVAQGGQPGVETKVLLESGQSAWGETNLVGGAAELDAKDYAGPVGVMTVSTRSVSDADKRSEEARLITTGDSQFASNKLLSVQGNRDVAVNAVHWLAEEQARIAIHPRSRGQSQIFLTGEQMGQLKFFSQDILPVLIVAMGFGIVLVRKSRRR